MLIHRICCQNIIINISVKNSTEIGIPNSFPQKTFILRHARFACIVYVVCRRHEIVNCRCHFIKKVIHHWRYIRLCTIYKRLYLSLLDSRSTHRNTLKRARTHFASGFHNIYCYNYSITSKKKRFISNCATRKKAHTHQLLILQFFFVL